MMKTEIKIAEVMEAKFKVVASSTDLETGIPAILTAGVEKISYRKAFSKRYGEELANAVNNFKAGKPANIIGEEFFNAGGRFGVSILCRALNLLKVDRKIKIAVVKAVFGKVACDYNVVWKAVKDRKYSAMNVIETAHLIPATKWAELGGKGIPHQKGYKVDTPTLLVEYYKNEFGVDAAKKSGTVGTSVTVSREGDVSSKGGYLCQFGEGKYSFPIRNIVSVEFGAIMKALGTDDPTIEKRWVDFNSKGFLRDKDGWMYENTKFNQKAHPDATLYINASETDSSLKRGSVLFFDMGTMDYEEARQKLEETRNMLNDGMTELLGISNMAPTKAAKRNFSAADSKGLELAEIDLSKNSIVVNESKWVDQREIADTKGLNIDNCPLDGLGYMRLSAAKKFLEAYLGIELNDAAVLVANLQMRITGLGGKLFCKIISDEKFDLYMEKVVNGNSKYHVIGEGEAIILGDANCIKLIKEYINSPKEFKDSFNKLKLLVLDVAHYGKSKMNLNIQISNKFSDRETYNDIAVNAVREELSESVRSVAKGENYGKTMDPFSTISDMMCRRKGKKAIMYPAVQKDVIKKVIDKANPIINKGATPVKGCMLALSMDEAPVLMPNVFDQILVSNGDVTEIYASDMIKHRRELFKDGKLHDCYAFKMPSAGKDEHMKCRVVTLMELACRVAVLLQEKVNKKELTVDEAARLAYTRVFDLRFDGTGTVMMANLNVAGNKLAGLDKDFDKIIIITEEKLVEALDAKGVNNCTVIDTTPVKADNKHSLL